VRVDAQDMTFIMRIHPYGTIDNSIDGVVITFVDISGRKKAEERAALLLGELDHRVKNILSIVSAVVKQTLKSSPSPKDFAQNI
jgi:two-component system CheB/CheR fusion protein